MTQSRRMLVLRAVVEDYIRSQEPVGSTTLTKDHDLGVSSATVRNDMATLEDEGYLIQPHTSAGRIPTEKGYRYFVDRLATVVPMSEAQRRGINSFLSGSVNLQDTLQRAARLLAQITGQVAVVAAPSLAKSTLRHIEIVPVSINTLLAVVITDTGRVAQHMLNVSELPDTTVLSHLVNEINAQCASVSLTRTADYVRQMSSRKEYRSISKLAETLAQAFDGMADDERASDAVADCACLTGKSAALDVDEHVVLIGGVGQRERLIDDKLEGVESEIIVQTALVYVDGAGAGNEANASDCLFTTAGAPILQFLLSGSFRCHN